MTQDPVSPCSKQRVKQDPVSPSELVCPSDMSCYFHYVIFSWVMPSSSENRVINSLHPLFEGGTAEVALDRLCVPLHRLCVPLASLGGHRGSLGRLQLGATFKQGMLLIVQTTGLRTKKAYTHSGTPCPKCVHQMGPEYN